MNVDYYELMRDAAKFTWKYKILWIFGFILAMFSGNSSSNISNNYDSSDFERSTDQTTSTTADSISEFIDGILDSPYMILIIAGICLIVIILGVISWYLKTIAQGALINANRFDTEGNPEKIKFKELWVGVHPYLGKLFIFSFLWGLAGLVFMIVLSAPLFLFMFAGPAAVAFICCYIIPYFVAILLVSAVMSSMAMIVMRLIILKDMDIMTSIRTSFEILKKYLAKLFFGWLSALVPGCIVAIIIFGIMLITIIPIALGVLALIAQEETVWFGIGLGGCGCTAIILLLAAIQSPYQVFIQTYWNKLLSLFINDEVKGGSEVQEAVIV